MRSAALLSALMLLVAACSCGPGERGGPPPMEPGLVLHLTRERARLAASGRFYYELDLSRRELSLCHSGVPLRSYRASEISVGRPRVLFFKRGGGRWVGEVWSQGHLDPPKEIRRVRIVPGVGPSPSAPGGIPPTLEELIGVPPAYRIRFDAARSLDVRMEGEIPGLRATGPAWGTRRNEFLEGLGVRGSDRLRLRLTLTATDGAALFRSFPNDSPDLLVLPGEPASGNP